MTDTRPMTKGKARVGLSFNPSDNVEVDVIKRDAAMLIDLIEGIPLYPSPKLDRELADERDRLKALAQKAIEEGAMWAVKAATKL